MQSEPNRQCVILSVDAVTGGSDCLELRRYRRVSSHWSIVIDTISDPPALGSSVSDRTRLSGDRLFVMTRDITTGNPLTERFWECIDICHIGDLKDNSEYMCNYLQSYMAPKPICGTQYMFWTVTAGLLSGVTPLYG